MKYDDFFTLNTRKWLANNKPIIGNYDGFYIKDDKVVLFNPNIVDDFLGKCKIYFYLMSEEKYNIFKSMDIKHGKAKMCSYVYLIDSEFIELSGKKYKKVRYGYNRYKDTIQVKNDLHLSDMLEMISVWKSNREDRHWRISVNTERNFLKNHYSKDLITKCFYINDKIVGYSVVEHIRDNLFNLLFRKINTEYSQLIYCIDYMTYRDIYDKYGNFYINSGDDGGEKDAKFFKTKNFNVVEEFLIYSVFIEKDMLKCNKLFY